MIKKNIDTWSLLKFMLLAYIFTCGVSAYLGGPVVYAFIVLYSLYYVLCKDKTVKTINYLCLGILVVAFLSIVINFRYIEPVFRPMERIIVLSVVMLAFAPIINNKSLFLFRKKVFLYFSIGFSIMAIASALLALNGWGYDNGFLWGLSQWPNSLGYALVIAVIVMLVSWTNASWTVRCFLLLIIGLCVFTIPQTGTRTALYSLPVIFFLYTYFTSNSIKSWLKKLILMLAVLACFFAFVKLDLSIIEAKNDYAEQRGEDSREDLFETRIKEFATSPIWGIGTFSCLLQYQKVNASGNVEAGNSFLMFLSMNGIIGFVVFMSFYLGAIFNLAKYIIKKRKDKLSPMEQYICLVLVFNFIYMLQAGALLNPGFYTTGFNWLSLSMAYMYPRYKPIIDLEKQLRQRLLLDVREGVVS